jgi:hypothetical protein
LELFLPILEQSRENIKPVNLNLFHEEQFDIKKEKKVEQKKLSVKTDKIVKSNSKII